QALARALTFAEHTARTDDREPHARQAASALYHAASAILLAWEGTRRGADARRVILARMVLDHRLTASDPLAPPADAWERDAIAMLLADGPVGLAEAAAAIVA